MASEKLGSNGTEHDKHEKEEDHDVEHDWKRVKDGRDQLGHVRDLVDRTQWTKDTDNLNGGDVARVDDGTEPSQNHDAEIHLNVRLT